MTDSVDYCKICFHDRREHTIASIRNQDPTYPCSHINETELGTCSCTDYVHGETRVTSSTGASKGTKEARYDLIPIPALDKLARLYGKGAVKYAEHNWRLGYDWSKSYAAAQRHMNAFWSGEDIDPETQIPHTICAAFHMFALTTYLEEHPEFDDRFETRDSRSDDDEDQPVDPKKFFEVKSQGLSAASHSYGFYHSKEKAAEKIFEIESTENDPTLNLMIMEWTFQDD